MMPAEIGRERAKSESEEIPPEARGDPEMAPVYLQRLLPIFCSTYHSTMIPSVRYWYTNFNTSCSLHNG